MAAERFSGLSTRELREANQEASRRLATLVPVGISSEYRCGICFKLQSAHIGNTVTNCLDRELDDGMLRESLIDQILALEGVIDKLSSVSGDNPMWGTVLSDYVQNRQKMEVSLAAERERVSQVEANANERVSQIEASTRDRISQIENREQSRVSTLEGSLAEAREEARVANVQLAESSLETVSMKAGFDSLNDELKKIMKFWVDWATGRLNTEMFVEYMEGFGYKLPDLLTPSPTSAHFSPPHHPDPHISDVITPSRERSTGTPPPSPSPPPSSSPPPSTLIHHFPTGSTTTNTSSSTTTTTVTASGTGTIVSPVASSSFPPPPSSSFAAIMGMAAYQGIADDDKVGKSMKSILVFFESKDDAFTHLSKEVDILDKIGLFYSSCTVATHVAIVAAHCKEDVASMVRSITHKTYPDIYAFLEAFRLTRFPNFHSNCLAHFAKMKQKANESCMQFYFRFSYVTQAMRRVPDEYLSDFLDKLLSSQVRETVSLAYHANQIGGRTLLSIATHADQVEEQLKMTSGKRNVSATGAKPKDSKSEGGHNSGKGAPPKARVMGSDARANLAKQELWGLPKGTCWSCLESHNFKDRSCNRKPCVFCLKSGHQSIRCLDAPKDRNLFDEWKKRGKKV